MVALRKRPQRQTEQAAPPSEPAAAEILASAPAEPTETSGEPSEGDALRQQLQELQRAEELQRHQAEQEFKARLAADLRPDISPQQQQKPQYSERDLQFLGARGPDILKDVRFVQMARNLPLAGIEYGSDRFYEILESEFPISDYRSADKLPFQEKKAQAEEVTPQQAEPQPQAEKRVHVSAPPSREVASYSGRRDDYIPSPSSVRLSPDERQIAASSGMTELQYAKNKLELQRRKRAGLVQDG